MNNTHTVADKEQVLMQILMYYFDAFFIQFIHRLARTVYAQALHVVQISGFSLSKTVFFHDTRVKTESLL